MAGSTTTRKDLTAEDRRVVMDFLLQRVGTDGKLRYQKQPPDSNVTRQLRKDFGVEQHISSPVEY